MEDNIRSFIAIDISRESINEIKKVQELLKKNNLFSGKFTEPENLHLTLKFLGEIDPEKIALIDNELKKIKFKSFKAELKEIGVFSKKQVRIIWIKLGGEGVFDLQKKVDNFLKDLFIPEVRFMSHITIARVKHIPNNKNLVEYLKSIKLKKISNNIDRFFLKKSELKSNGPVYEDLHEYIAS